MDTKRRFIKPFFKYYDHYAMTPSIVELLNNDGNENIYNLLKSRDSAAGKSYLGLLARGARDADLPWSRGYILHTYHYHHPWTHRGYLTYRSAADVLAGLFTIGHNLWTHGKKDRAIYQLGRMLHLVQDIFIPHHAAVTAIRGHGQLETWLSGNWHLHRVDRGGCYSWENTFSNPDDATHTVSSQNPYDWIDAGSHVSIEWYRKYFLDYKDTSFQGFFPELAEEVIPYMLRYSAGFIDRFFIGLTL